MQNNLNSIENKQDFNQIQISNNQIFIEKVPYQNQSNQKQPPIQSFQATNTAQPQPQPQPQPQQFQTPNLQPQPSSPPQSQ